MDDFLKLLGGVVLDVIDDPAVQRLLAKPLAKKMAEKIPGEVAEDTLGSFFKVIGQELIDASDPNAPPPSP